jgi:flavin-dependent dehydrogenase
MSRGPASAACDVAILGGGPAGSATALALAGRAPGLGIVLVEASAYERPRLGETLPPPARRLLEQLGAWEAFAGEPGRELRREVWGTAAAWGSAVPRAHDFLFAGGGAGWHLDRAAFDALLAAQAEKLGVRALLRTRLRGAAPAAGGWRLELSGAGPRQLDARFVVDATGCAAVFARRHGARLAADDRLVGFARFFEGGDPDPEPRTLVEAFADGWWYTAGLPGGRRVVTCLTDADLARGLGLGDAARWRRLLAATAWAGETVRGARARGPLAVRPAPSRRLEPAAGEGWLAVGDAASSFDPLSSAGIVKALRSGLFASYAIADLLVGGGGDGRGLDRHRQYVRAEYDGYARVRARQYAAEHRWPRSEFWRRRRASPAASLRTVPMKGFHD